ncbi:MAG: HD domain-containing protein, partial [Elusimicrobiota bacterium]
MNQPSETNTQYSKDLFLEHIKNINPNLDIALIEKAFLFSYEAHRNQYRMSGLPFFAHPVEVAKILAEQKMDTDTICAG